MGWDGVGSHVRQDPSDEASFRRRKRIVPPLTNEEQLDQKVVVRVRHGDDVRFRAADGVGVEVGAWAWMCGCGCVWWKRALDVLGWRPKSLAMRVVQPIASKHTLPNVTEAVRQWR